MPHIRILLIGLTMAFVSHSSASTRLGSGVAISSKLYQGNNFVLAQYITPDEQRRRAEENLQRRRDERQREQSRGRPDERPTDRAETNEGHFDRGDSNYDVRLQQSPYNMPARRP